MDFSGIKFRASSFGNLMTEPQSKADKDAGKLSATCIKELVKIYNMEIYGRKRDITTAAMEKGRQCEAEAISLFSMLEGNLYFKNEEELENEWFRGHPDIYAGSNILEAKEVSDIKCSWDLDTFMPKLMEEPDKGYIAQLNCYYSLTGAQYGHLVYCLISAPLHILNQELESLQYRMAKNTDRIDITQDFNKAAKELHKLMVFEDIPPEERCIKIPIPRDEELIEKMKAKVPRLREWLEAFHKKHKSLYNESRQFV